MSLLATLLRAYLAVAGVFELLSIAQVREQGATRTSPILRELVGGGHKDDVRRGLDLLWTGFLLNLSLSRFALAYDFWNKTLFSLVLAVHVAELALFVLAVPLTRLKPEHWALPVAAVQALALFVAWVAVVIF